MSDPTRMTRGRRYHWARSNRSLRGRANDRRAHLVDRFGVSDPEITALALARRRAQLARLATAAAAPAAAPPPIGGPPAPPHADDNLWVPLGPTVLLQGAGGGLPRVTGRVNDVWVSPDGGRAYAATAGGGVWYSSDRGDSWSPLGGWAVMATPLTVIETSNVLACGCLYVRFDPGGNAANDEVLVGTGERIPSVDDPLPNNKTAGVGILRAVGPSAADEFAQVWQVEATNLSGLGIFRIAVDPTTPTTFLAATSSGLWMRTGGPAAAWVVVPSTPFNTPAGRNLVCTDVLWTPAQGTTPSRIWVAVRDTTGNQGIWFASDWTPQNHFNFTQLTPPGLLPGSLTTLAAAPSDVSIVYALSRGGLVWRMEGLPPHATRVLRIPPSLLGTQDNYNQGIAVHPTRPDRIILGGQSVITDGTHSASLYLANVTGPVGGNYQFGFTSPAAHPEQDDSFIGFGVHADVHIARFVPVPGGTEIWVGSDGGVFRSPQGNADNRLIKRTFAARNTGMAALQAGYIATHPLVDGYLLSGFHDNGTVERVGDTIWRMRFAGDGGGLAFNPLTPDRFFFQKHDTDWRDDGAHAPAFTRPVRRTALGVTSAQEGVEDQAAAFYSNCDAVLVPQAGATPARARLAFGTYRVWTSDDWGATWRTLPSLTDPMAGPQNNNVDATVRTGGAPNYTRGRVMACRWASPTRLFVLCVRAVLQYDFVADAHAATGFRVTVTELTRQKEHSSEDRQAATAVQSPGQVLPALGAWSDLAIHDPAREAHGSFYVGATGHSQNLQMDTLWWFDGDDRWFKTNLRNDHDHGIPAPVSAVVVDPVNRNHVYVGTSVGVWRGTFSNGPHWDWEVFSTGLPEAPVQDLTITTAGGARLLRAAVQSRGIWEVDLAAPGTARTFVRAHAYDSRRVVPTALTDPARPVPNSALSWHASPDVRVRPRQGSRPPNPHGLPWTRNANDAYGLWVFQTALRTQARFRLCPATGRWSTLFDGCVRDLTGTNRITLATWNTIVGTGASFPNAYADPWTGAAPTEADLFELIVDLPAPAGSDASIGIRPVHAKVDVLVHHRHLRPVPAASVKITLLRRDVAHTNAAAWAALVGDWTADVQAFLRAGGGGGAPALPAGWSFADAAHPIRDASGPVDARLPRAATFDADLHALAPGTRVLLVAIVHSAVDQVTLPNQTLRTLTLGTRFVSVRSLEIV